MDFTRAVPNSEKVRRYAEVVDIYIVMGTLALVACITLIVSIIIDKRLRQHPGQIIIYITFCDLILTLKFFIGAVIWKLAHDPGYNLVSSSFSFIYDKCASESLISQFVFGASMGWNLVSVVDFTVELYDPLRNTRSLVKYYHVFVWLWAAATVAYVGLADVFGPSADGTCYVTKQSVEWALFQVPVMIVMFSGVLSVLYALARLPHGTASSKLVRRRLLKRQICYVAIFVGCWILPVIHRFNAHTGVNDTLLVLDAIGISAQGLCLPLYRLLQREVRFSVDWLPCCWPCRVCECGRSWLYKGRESLTRRFTTIEPHWGLHSPLLPPRPRNDSDSIAAVPSGPVDSGSLNGYSGVDRSLHSVFVPEQMAHSWDSRRISMHNMSLKSEGLGDEDGVAAWGVGKELRRDFGMLLLDGIVKFVTTVKVSDEEASGVSGAPLTATVAMSFQDFSSGRTSPFFSAVDDQSGPLQRHDSLKNIGKLVDTPLALSPLAQSPDDVDSVLSGDSSVVTSLPAPIVGSFPGKLLTREASFSKSSAISRVPSAASNLVSNRESHTLRGAKANGKRIRVSGETTIVGLEAAKFAAIRSLLRVKGSEIKGSLHPDKLAAGEIEAKFSEGRSSSFFCKSADNLFIVKTLEYDEVICLLEFLPDYYEHLRRNPGTLISLIYGLYCLEAPTCSDVYAIVMSNVFRPPHGLCMDEVYDLKGSTYHRQAEDDVSEKPAGVLMDVDFERRRRDSGLRLGPVIGSAFLTQLRKDVELLMGNGFMDYSLLVGVRKLSEEELSSMGDSGSTGRENSQILRFPSQASFVSAASAEMSLRGEEAGSGDTADAANRRLSARAPTRVSDHLLPAASEAVVAAFVNRTGFLATGPSGNALGTEIYMIGIIDILQKYTIRKKIEHKLKSLRQRTWDSDKISAVDVPAYAARFLEFVTSIVR